MAVVLIWGSSFVAVKYALQSFSPLWIAALRLVLGASVLAALAIPLKIRLPNNVREWASCVVIGLVSTTLPFSLIGMASQHVPSGSAGLLMATSPILVTLISIVALPEEKITLPRLIGLVLGFIGTGLVIAGRSDVSALQISDTVGVWPYVGLLIASTCYAIFTVSGRRFTDIPVLTRVLGNLICAAVGSVIIVLVFEPFPATATPIAIGSLVYLGIIATTISMIIMLWLVGQTSASFAAQSNYLIPVTAVIFGAILFKEHLGTMQYGGMALILLGIGVAERMGRRKAANKAKASG